MSKREIIKKIERPEQIEFAAQWAREMTEKALKAGPLLCQAGCQHVLPVFRAQVLAVPFDLF